MLTKIQTLIDELNAGGLTYCHWKSNLALPASLEGRTDLDLLIHRESGAAFKAMLRRLDFRQADMRDPDPLPAMEHYYALDEPSGKLVHVHAYYAVITGESLAKNYRLPIEEMLFRNTRRQDGVRVPIKSAELIVFTLRMLLKHTSLVELFMLARDWKKVKQEAAWLTECGSTVESMRLISRWLPAVSPELFSECVSALAKPAPLHRRIILGARLQRRLRMYSRHSALSNSVTGLRRFTGLVVGRLDRSRRGMALRSGGAVIAFVGPEATGKSTLLSEVRGWLGEYFAVDQIHAGKPKSTALSAAPNLLVPLLRSLLPSYRSGNVEVQYSAEDASNTPGMTFPLIFGIRSVLLAYDRRALLTRARARACGGTVVLCDRYPSTVSGATDSPQLARFDVSRDRSPVRRLLARLEKRFYEDIPAPDLVISLSVPLEMAIARNKTRGKEEPEDFVRRRHAQSSLAVFKKSPVVKVCTDQPLEQTVSTVKQAIWQVL
jgi:hypothetical protein